jgi:hypothetical protein
MVNLRMRKTMKRNKVKKHQKYSRKHKKTIKQKRQHKRGKYSKTLRGGDICLKEVTNKTPPEVNRIGDENTNLPKKSSWGFGSLFGNKKTETPPIETTPIETSPIEEVKIVDEKIKDDIKNPLLSPEIEDTSIVSSPLQPGEAGFVKPPPPSTPNPYLNTTPNKIEDTTIENSEIIEDSMSPPPPPKSEQPTSMLDQIKEGVKLKSVSENSNIPPPPPPPAKKNELSDVADVFKEGIKDKFKNTGMNQEEEEEEEEEDKTWRDSEGGKTRRRRRNKKSTRKNSKKVSKKR